MRMLPALIAAAMSFSSAVYAQALTCATAASGPNNIAVGGFFAQNYDLQAGETLTVTTSGTMTGRLGGGGAAGFTLCGGTTCSLTAAAAENGFNISIGNASFTTPITATVSCSAAGAGGGGGGGAGAGGGAAAAAGGGTTQPTITQVNNLRQQLLGIAAQATGQSQGFNVGAAIRNAIAGAPGFTKQPIRPFGDGGLYFQAPISDPDGLSGFEAWAAFSASTYDGTTEGTGLDLTFGIQRQVTDALTAGLAGSYGTLDLNSGGSNVDARAFVAGPYFAYQHQNLNLNGFILYGRPDYDFGGGVSADASRLTYSLGVSGRFPQSRYIVSPFLNLSGFQEDIDAAGTLAAQDISQYALGVGSRVDFETRGAFDPYVAIGFDAWEFDNGTSRSDGISPRLEAGFSMQAGAGSLSADFSAAEISNDVRRYGVSLRYDLRF
ncbi:autotransporter outer membrane beta-barrel domain-containing protein [Pontivivens insulae]|uniref:Autotransporter domain-containing protein n=1 Tax=Pontivivens insulae TaxID=1639689 RepID=A0A2R8A8H6_9RHOB|nr:autotransporter outer membrane beta-barrel domain-containing protein [Pontivivens insulae]RED18625.1 hypothetical protein DFR53_0823 [Pontivivens insulae]SPF28523.1 hypothetical protein POI8812_00824 [Pontivivens insulae]